MASQDDVAAFRAAAQSLNDAADKGLRKEVYAAFRKAAKPLGEKVIAEGSAKLPKRGGLSARVTQSRMGQSNSTTGRNPGVALSFRTKPAEKGGQSYDLKSMDEGTIRHPTFGRRGKGDWRVTKVKPGSFRKPFEAGAPPVAQQIVAALNDVAARVAHDTRKAGR